MTLLNKNTSGAPVIKGKYIRITAVLSIICIMIGLAEILNESEIIFPEIAAIAVGAIAAPKRTWQTSSIRILFNITLCALAGLLIVRFLPVSVWLQLSIAYGVSQIYFLYSKTNFAPMISAITLPVLLQTRSIEYLIAAIGLTSFILLLRELLIRCNILKRDEYKPVLYPTHEMLRLAGVRWIVATGLMIVAFKLGLRFIVAPPLLVAFTEFARPYAPPAKRPVKTVLLLAGCAAVGTFARMVLSEYYGLPLTFAAIIAFFIVMQIIYMTQMYIPPAGALCILAMLIPAGELILFPVQVLVAASIYMLVARLVCGGRD